MNTDKYFRLNCHVVAMHGPPLVSAPHHPRQSCDQKRATLEYMLLHFKMNNLIIIKAQILTRQDIRDKTLLMHENNELLMNPASPSWALASDSSPVRPMEQESQRATPAT
jgi:hypothetical protein